MSPLQIPEAEFRQKVRTLCAVAISSDVDLPEERLAAVQETTTAILREHGWALVDASTFEECFMDAGRVIGDLYDPHTAEPDRDRLARARRHALDAAGCDASVQAHVAVVTAPFIDGTARWDGAAIPIANASSSSGWIPALTLWVTMLDADGNTLYFGTGGIELLAKIDSGFFSEQLSPEDPKTMLADRERWRPAIFRALEPLVAVDAPASGSKAALR